MTNKKIKILALTLSLIFSFLLVLTSAQAAQPASEDNSIQGLLNQTAGNQGAGYNTALDSKTGLATVAGTIVRGFLSLLGIIFVCYTIYGGYLWLTSAGNEEKTTKAKHIIRDGIIGLAIILAAAVIYQFITFYLIQKLRPLR
jgi:TRAP-type C4-dicarboxylate transport system permease small subunit